MLTGRPCHQAVPSFTARNFYGCKIVKVHLRSAVCRSERDRLCTYNVTFCRFYLTNVSTESNNAFWVCRWAVSNKENPEFCTRTLLWRIYVSGNNRIYLRLREKYQKPPIPHFNLF
jgi:hypothetical protein